MIIFYETATGRIVGSISGRVNSPEELNMWIGDRNTTERIVVTWKPVKQHPNLKGEVIKVDFEPDHYQKDVFSELEKFPMSLYAYKINKAGKLAKIK